MQNVCSTRKKIDNTHSHSNMMMFFWRSWRRPGWPIHQNGLHSNNYNHKKTKTNTKKNKIRRRDPSKRIKELEEEEKHGNSFFTRCCPTFKKWVGGSVCVCVRECDHHFHKSISLQTQSRQWGYCRSWATGPGPEHGRRAPIKR